jgi:hypothetical protein
MRIITLEADRHPVEHLVELLQSPVERLGLLVFAEELLRSP